MRFSILIFLSIIFFASCQQAKNPNTGIDDFLGSWELQKWTARLTNGTEVYPYGEKAYGKLIYEKGGDMLGILMADNRNLMSSDDVSNRSAEEALAAFNSFFAYSGTYNIHRDSGFVIHHVEACINPNWVGRKQKRFFKFEQGMLILSTPPIEVQGTQRQAVKQTLIWKKI